MDIYIQCENAQNMVSFSFGIAKPAAGARLNQRKSISGRYSAA
jgi:hypothetical protein